MRSMSDKDFNTLDHVDDSDDNLNLLGRKWVSSPKGRLQKCKIFLLSCCSALALLGIIVQLASMSVSLHGIEKSIHLKPTGLEFGDCGSSHTIEEARESGCLFDPMSWLWVRPECYDQELIDNFMNRTDWSWHSDWKLTPESRIPLEEVVRGDHAKLFTQKKYHSVHCTYMWQKMHKALLEHRPVDTDLTSWHHTLHCEQVLLNEYLHEDEACDSGMICPTWVRATWTGCGYA